MEDKMKLLDKMIAGELPQQKLIALTTSFYSPSNP